MFGHQLRVDLLALLAQHAVALLHAAAADHLPRASSPAIFKGETVVDGHHITISTFYVPGIMTLGIVSASYLNLTQTVVDRREGGELKRLRGTPLPALLRDHEPGLVGVVVAVVMSGDPAARSAGSHTTCDPERAWRADASA